MLANHPESRLSNGRPKGADFSKGFIRGLFQEALSRHFANFIPVAATRLGWAMAGEQWKGRLAEAEETYSLLVAQHGRLINFAQRRGFTPLFALFREERGMLDAIERRRGSHTSDSAQTNTGSLMLRPQILDQGVIRITPDQMTPTLRAFREMWPESIEVIDSGK